MWMDAKLARELIVNGFAFIAFLVIIVMFVRQVVVILDRRLGQMIDKIDMMISSHHNDQIAIIEIINRHNSDCESRCDRLSKQFSEHSRLVSIAHQRLIDIVGLEEDKRDHK